MNRGYGTGYNEGFDEGYAKGYREGVRQGQEAFAVPFEGTSIVIPSFNQRDLLRQCLESVQAFTPEPHEIIVVDNGSDDGTEDYLKSLGRRIRYRRTEENLGFAGGVNLGLMMARGTTLLILNNDTVVTAGWLGNLLNCLAQFPNAGLVGSVTNYISGEQLVETSYRTLEEMHAFAAGRNRRDPAEWRSTGRLTGFCVLLRRELFARLGYFDEGFRIGNCEDDDFGLRARLLGVELVIAGDCFIHHVGSASMKSLGERFDKVYGDNLAYYSQKWGDPHALLACVKPLHAAGQLKTVDFYPSHVVVKGAGSTVYWIEGGRRHPIVGEAPEPPVRLSQLDVRSWPLGADIGAGDVLARLAAASSQSLAEGVLLRSVSGAVYQYRKGVLHLAATERALRSWGLDRRPAIAVSDEAANGLPKGAPIIAPPVIRSALL